jgi:hypothetical protein
MSYNVAGQSVLMLIRRESGITSNKSNKYVLKIFANMKKLALSLLRNPAKFLLATKPDAETLLDETVSAMFQGMGCTLQTCFHFEI